MKNLRHPLTGELLRPIFIDKHGEARWPIMGASETPPEGSQGGNNDSGSQSGSGGSGDGAQSGAQSDEGDKDGQRADTVSRSEFDAVTRRLQAADRARAEAQTELDKIKDKDKSELERAQGQVATLEKEKTDLQSEVRHLHLKVAFLSDTTYTWHDPADALMHLERDDTVTIDDDGKVQGMDAAIKRLADTKKYLVKPKDEGNDDDDAQGRQRSGAPAGGAGRGKKGDKNSREELLSRYPALRR